MNSFVECCRLDPLDIITNNVDSLSKIIKDRKENAKKKDDDGGKDIYCGVSDQEKESEKQKLGKQKEHVQDMRTQQVSMHSEDQCKVDVHGGEIIFHFLFILACRPRKKYRRICHRLTAEDF